MEATEATERNAEVVSQRDRDVNISWKDQGHIQQNPQGRAQECMQKRRYEREYPIVAGFPSGAETSII